MAFLGSEVFLNNDICILIQSELVYNEAEPLVEGGVGIVRVACNWCGICKGRSLFNRNLKRKW